MKFYVLNGRKIKRSLILLLTALFTATFLYMNNLHLAVFSSGEEPQVFYRGEEKSKHVALTFNLNWGDEKALPILDILKAAEIDNATFFLSASWAERHPDIVKRIKEDGHEIGTLGYTYQNYTDYDVAKIKRDLSKAKEVFEKMEVRDIELMRTPTGGFNKEILKAVDSYDYTLVHWSIDSKDETNPGVKEIVNKTLIELKGGDVILLHASDSAKQTAKALPLIIKGMKKSGYSNIPISELIANTEASSKEVK
ncbi:polysaccharide deacetylase family sporulation protein PdaB [Bacillus tianshenii]|nr:polysaccharide deacetylase family sporulation protein PdaB [Bacillus tianshenii]